MMSNNQPFNGYDNGAEFWRDTALCHGIDEAIGICTRYLEMQLKRDNSDDERQFCRELFAAMYGAKVNKAEQTLLVYPYDFETAHKRMEDSCYHASRRLNAECAQGIDNIIDASCYDTNYYNLEFAAMIAINKYGFNRVNLVLAFNFQNRTSDGRFSAVNRKWANSFTMQEKAFNNTWLQSHATLIDGIADYVRKFNTELDAGRYALPGEVVSSEVVQGYEIIRSVTFDNERGFVIAHNPNAVNPYVVWRFKMDAGEKEYFWGYYVNDEQSAAENYIARIFVHTHDGRASATKCDNFISERNNPYPLCDNPACKESATCNLSAHMDESPYTQ